ncbi:hypothetical protein [Paenibacillus azoreducens]|uniref:hypothetical protein n=1 Tax=Paenibacillus azoreducens TaxID=116718 RepID=UPI001BB3C4AA|nr:hypothetical protein [Paenibacillus azoreducens]
MPSHFLIRFVIKSGLFEQPLKLKKEQPLQDETFAGAYRFADRQASFSVLNGSVRSFRNVRSHCSWRS